MQSSPNRSESARTTTRPSPWAATAASGALGCEAVGWARAMTRAPLLCAEGAGAVEAGGARRRRAGRHPRARPRRGGRRARRGPRRGRRRGGARSPGRSRFSTRTPKRASRSLRLVPYLSCSVSPSTIRPPPARTKESIASISAGSSSGEPPSTVASHFGSDGWAMTSTAVVGEHGVGERPGRCGRRSRTRAPRAPRRRGRARSRRGGRAGSRRRPRGGSSTPRSATRRRGRGRSSERRSSNSYGSGRGRRRQY